MASTSSLVFAYIVFHCCRILDEWCFSDLCFNTDLCFFFFFKQKTAYEMRISDWSSDVCSSDRTDDGAAVALVAALVRATVVMAAVIATVVIAIIMAAIVIVAAILMVARLRGRRGRGHHCRRPHRDGGTGKRHDLELLQHCWSPCFPFFPDDGARRRFGRSPIDGAVMATRH